jgi:hypothetical protein
MGIVSSLLLIFFSSFISFVLETLTKSASSRPPGSDAAFCFFSTSSPSTWKKIYCIFLSCSSATKKKISWPLCVCVCLSLSLFLSYSHTHTHGYINYVYSHIHTYTNTFQNLRFSHPIIPTRIFLKLCAMEGHETSLNMNKIIVCIT